MFNWILAKYRLYPLLMVRLASLFIVITASYFAWSHFGLSETASFFSGSDRGANIYKAISSITAPLFGFTMATIGIMSVLDTPEFIKFRISGNYNHMWTRLGDGVSMLALMMGLGLFGQAISGWESTYTLYFHAFSLTILIITSWRVFESIVFMRDLIKSKISKAEEEIEELKNSGGMLPPETLTEDV